MKVGFDISQLAYNGGVATYTKNLADQLLKHDDIKLKFFYSSFRNPYKNLLRSHSENSIGLARRTLPFDLKSERKGNLPHVKSFPLPTTILETLFNRIRIIPIEWFIGPVDVFHSSDWTQPPSFAKKVTTYHDVVPLKYPQWSHPKIVEVHKRRLEIVEKEIDMVIAVSESTKRDLLEITKIPKEKITVVYEAASGDFTPQPQEKVKEFRKKYNLPDEFILAIGGIGERRNLKRVKQVCKDYHLVITGETIPWIPDDQMPLLYSAATVLLYPSLYEGFGLPVLDSFKCGTPVITSKVSSLPEVGGNAALYVDPNNVSDIEKKLKTLIKDKDLQKELIKKGFEQAKKFSWEKCAKETAEVYRKVVKK